jgi:hypothetical protein
LGVLRRQQKSGILLTLGNHKHLVSEFLRRLHVRTHEIKIPQTIQYRNERRQICDLLT